jgi:hypothetical protein
VNLIIIISRMLKVIEYLRRGLKTSIWSFRMFRDKIKGIKIKGIRIFNSLFSKMWKRYKKIILTED